MSAAAPPNEQLPGRVYYSGPAEPEPQAPAPKAVELPRQASATIAEVVRLKQRSHTSFKKARAHPKLSREMLNGRSSGWAKTQAWMSSDAGQQHMQTTATYGNLSFTKGREVLNPMAASLEEARQAKFMRVEVGAQKFEDLDPAQQLERVSILRGMVDFMQHTWKMEMPSVIFSVTGSAEGFTLRPKFRDTFMSALLNATRSTNAWIVTGGSDQGIMKLVGDTLARGKQMETSLAVGCWGTVVGRTELMPNESKAQAELTEKMPSCTVWVDTDEPRVYTEDKLNQIYSRYGTVIGVSLAKESGYLKKLLKKAVASTSLRHADTYNGGPITPTDPDQQSEHPNGGGKALVTFRDPEDAESATRHPITKFHMEVSRHDPKSATVVLTATVFVHKRGSSEDAETYRLHETKILGQRGGAGLPFVYDGERGTAEPPDGAGGTLNPNHSHYLLIDTHKDGTFGQEIIFRSELLDFISFRHDAKKSSTSGDLDDLTSMIRGRSKDDKRSVPVVAFVYGGGPGTLNTILEHVRTCDPIIVVKGSGRAADLIVEWQDFCEEKDAYALRLGDPNHLMVKIQQKKVEARQESRLRTWLLKNKRRSILPKTPEEELNLQEDVKLVMKQLDEICAFEMCYFFDFQQKLDPTVKIGKDSLLARQGSNPYLLSIVLKAIFRSPTVRDSIKLPLAVRYGDLFQVKTLMKKQGIEQRNKGDELTTDSRPMIYAAFHDDHRTVQELLKHGCDAQVLDHLILSEFCGMLQHRQMLKQTKALEPPQSWLVEQVRKHMVSHKNEWIALTVEEQQHICLDQWKSLPLTDQQQISSEAIARVSWACMPYLQGYTYKVLGMSVKGDDGFDLSNGAVFRQTRVRHCDKQAASPKSSDFELETDMGIEMDLLPCEPISYEKTLVGRVISPVDAEHFAASLIAQSGETGETVIPEDVRWDLDVWVLVEVSGKSPGSEVKILLQQQRTDEITRCLVIDQPGRWLLSNMTPASLSRTCEAFQPWLPPSVLDGTATANWFDMYDASATHSWLSSELHPLHRLFWAIQTGREELAQLFWKQSSEPIVASFLASHTYRTTKQYAKSHAKLKAADFDEKAEALLNALLNIPLLASANSASGGNMRVLFNEYVYFSVSAEDVEKISGTVTQFAMLTSAEKKLNAKIRSALRLMGADPALTMTRLDLAIKSENKRFMAHRATQEFLDSMWRYNLGNGDWLDTVLKTSPRTKFRLKLLGYVAAILVLWVTFVSMPPAGEIQWPNTWEMAFWLWWFGEIADELQQWVDAKTFTGYMSGSGNTLDFFVNVPIALAGCCRVAGAVSGGEFAVWTYRSMMLLLMLAVFAMSFRLMHMFSFSRRLGIIQIILSRIMQLDVIPFMLYLSVTLASFEVASTFFAWLHDVPLADRAWGYSLIGFSESINDLRFGPDVTNLAFENQIGEALQASVTVRAFREFFNMSFFVVTVVILMNVLIAMMANTFSVVIELAEEEWRLIFAGMVREYFDSNVLPPPLNLLETVANRCKRHTMEARKSMHDNNGQDLPQWGQHYLFPVPPLRFHLPMAMSGYLAAQKDQGQRGIKHIIGKLDKTLKVQQDSLARGGGGEQPGDGKGAPVAHQKSSEAKKMLAELRKDSKHAMDAIGNLSSDVSGVSQQIAAVLELVRETSLQGGGGAGAAAAAVGSGAAGAGEKPAWQQALDHEVAAAAASDMPLASAPAPRKADLDSADLDSLMSEVGLVSPQP